MTKFKSTYLALILALLICFSLLLCSDESSNDEETLIGTWILTKLKIELVPGMLTEIDPAIIGFSMTITVKEDNTYTSVITEEGVTDTFNGTWEKSGNNILMTEEGETQEIEYSLQGDTLELTFIEDGDPVIYVFSRQ